MQNFDLEEIFGMPLNEVDAIIADMGSHVSTARIPKKSGGFRTITMPDDVLKELQRRILTRVLNKYHPCGSAHGFVRFRSTVTGAIKHCFQKSLFGADIKSFFDNITVKHVQNAFFGCCSLCKMCKHRDRGCTPSLYHTANRQEESDSVVVCEEIQAVHDPEFVPVTGYQSLMTRVIALTMYRGCAPQGFPTSPSIGNTVLRAFDAGMQTFTKKNNLVYTRYADDIAISSSTLSPKDLITTVLPVVRNGLFGFGFRLNKEKTRVHGRGRAMIVTGIRVNHHASIGRGRRRIIRAMIHNVMTGKTVLSWSKLAELKGHCAYLAMVMPRHASYLQRLSFWMRRNRDKITA